MVNFICRLDTIWSTLGMESLNKEVSKPRCRGKRCLLWVAPFPTQGYTVGRVSRVQARIRLLLSSDCRPNVISSAKLLPPRLPCKD